VFALAVDVAIYIGMDCKKGSPAENSQTMLRNLVPFRHKPENQLEEKLKFEWPAILRWMIDGCLDWQRNGLVRPDIVLAATDKYFEDQDVLGQWMTDECDIETANFYRFEMANSLFEAWKRYAIAAGVNPGTSAEFADALLNRGIKKHRISTGNSYRGISIRPAAMIG
jgi:putative DNA primase/helicase